MQGIEKLLKVRRAIGEEEKILLGLLTKLLKKLGSMLIGIEKQEKEVLDPYGFKELMLLQDLTCLLYTSPSPRDRG